MVKRSHHLPSLFLVLLLLGGIASCVQKEGGTKTGPVAARVNRSTVTVDEFNDLLGPENRLTMSPEDKREALEQWTERELVCQEALKQGLDKDRETRLLIENNRKEILVQKIMEKEISAKVPPVTPVEAGAYYNAHAPEYGKKLKVRILLVRSADLAKVLADSLRAGADFAALAKAHSKHPTALEGGLYSQYLMRPEAPNLAFGEAAFSLPKGGVSDAIRTPDGYYLVKIEDIQPLPQSLPLDQQLGEQIRYQLQFAKQRQVYEAWVDGLRKAAKIEVHPELVK